MAVERQLGLELYPDHQPVTPTLVYVRALSDYELFCHSCLVNPRHKNLICITDRHHSGRLAGLGSKWAHIAFIGMDPRELSSSQSWENNDSWYRLDRLREMGQFRRAFYYPHWAPSYIEPNIMEEGRTW